MKKFISVLLILVLSSICLTGCGSTNSSESKAPSNTSEETNNNNQKNSIKARIEMEDYQIHLDNPEDTTLHGTINHSYGQDIVALNENGEEIARVSLKGNNGDEESFSIVIPAKAITKKHNPTRIKGTELNGKVLETNTKMVSINVGSNE